MDKHTVNVGDYVFNKDGETIWPGTVLEIITTGRGTRLRVKYWELVQPRIVPMSKMFAYWTNKPLTV